MPLPAVPEADAKMPTILAGILIGLELFQAAGLSRFDHQSLGCEMVVILRASFVLENFTINFVNQKINRCIQVVLGSFAVDIFTANVERDFSSMLQWFE